MAADGTLSAISDILEKDILPTIQHFLPKETMLYDRFSQNKKSVRFNNNTIYFSAVVSGHAGVSTAAEGGDVGSGKPTYDQMNVSAKTLLASHKLTYQAIKACKGQPGALAGIVTQYAMEAKSQLAKDIDRQMITYGKGEITQVYVGANNATQTVKSAHALIIGEAYEIGTRAQIEGGTADAYTPTDVNYFDNQITKTGAITTATDDIVVRANCHSTTTYYDIMGIAGLTDKVSGGNTTTWQGVTRSGASWTGAYVEATAGQLQLSHVTTALQMAQRFGHPEFLITSETLQNRYASLLTGLKRMVNTTKLTGGWSGLAVTAGDREVPMAINYHLPLTDLYVITDSDFKMADLEPIGWLDEGEGIMKILPASSGQGVALQYQAALVGMSNLVNFNPRSSSSLRAKTA